jgi:RNA polymerase-binding protein DksA
MRANREFGRLARSVPLSSSSNARHHGATPRREANMDALKQDLEKRRTTVMRTLQTTMRSTREEGDRAEISKDPYGSASSSHDDELAAITVERLARDLKLIDRALADIDAGRYGTCVECEEPIAPKRLKALPFATRCVECQARSERLERVA